VLGFLREINRQYLVPAEIEKKILDCAGVSQVSVIAIKDALGKFILLAVVLKKLGVELSANDLKNFCDAHLPEAQRPKSFAFIPEFPVDSHGQINKYRLRFDFGTS
jgi:fatty-acyl-CoA synthase